MPSAQNDILYDSLNRLIVEAPSKHPINAGIYLNAKFFHEDRFTLIYHRGLYYAWTGTFWRVLNTEMLEHDVYRTFTWAVHLKEVDDPNNPGQKMDVHVDYGISRSKLDELMKAIKLRVIIDPDIDTPTLLTEEGTPDLSLFDPVDVVACRNVLLDTRTGQVHPHTPRLFNTFSVDFDYDPAAPAPTEWQHFLTRDEIGAFYDDPESLGTLQEMMGYLLTNRNEQQKMFMFIGEKRAGKGTIIRVLEKLLGGKKNVAPTSMSDLNSEFGLAGLDGKALAVMSDLRFRSRDDGDAVSRLLAITGGDSVRINRKFKEPHDAHLSVRFLIAANEVPLLRDESGALKSRVIMLNFQHSALGREDIELDAKLARELSGIFNWALEGLARLNERGRFIQPASAQQDLEVMGELGSPTEMFADECLTIDPAQMILSRELFGVWQEWCATTRTLVGSEGWFGKNLRAAIPKVRRVRKGPRGAQYWHYEGVGLNENGRAFLEQFLRNNMTWPPAGPSAGGSTTPSESSPVVDEGLPPI